LRQLARDSGLVVEKRQVAVEELADFSEVGSVGTAAVITPISSITYGDNVYRFGDPNTLLELYKQLVGIQNGDLPDKHGWMYKIAD
jgi:branched-chain amino acid aminotransferase